MLSRNTRVIVVGLLMLALASNALQALPAQYRTTPTPRTETAEFIKVIREWIASILGQRPEPSDRESLAVQKEEHGSQVDPDGNH